MRIRYFNRNNLPKRLRHRVTFQLLQKKMYEEEHEEIIERKFLAYIFCCLLKTFFFELFGNLHHFPEKSGLRKGS